MPRLVVARRSSQIPLSFSIHPNILAAHACAQKFVRACVCIVSQFVLCMCLNYCAELILLESLFTISTDKIQDFVITLQVTIAVCRFSSGASLPRRKSGSLLVVVSFLFAFSHFSLMVSFITDTFTNRITRFLIKRRSSSYCMLRRWNEPNSRPSIIIYIDFIFHFQERSKKTQREFLFLFNEFVFISFD